MDTSNTDHLEKDSLHDFAVWQLVIYVLSLVVIAAVCLAFRLS
jgi:hypothetical protein